MHVIQKWMTSQRIAGAGRESGAGGFSSRASSGFSGGAYSGI